MTKENQKKLYEHFKRLLINPNPNGIKGMDTNFVLKQAKEQIAELERVYPDFKEVPTPTPSPKETKSTVKK